MKLDAIADARDAALRPWLVRTRTHIHRRLADARRAAAEGRHDEAHGRLIELQETLGQQMSDARAAFYRGAFSLHRLDWDPEVHQDVRPDADGERIARTARHGDVDHYDQLEGLIERARIELRTSVAAGAPLTAWEGRQRERIGPHVEGALSDWQMSLHTAIGEILVKPELR